MRDARHIANEFIRRSKEQNRLLTHMQIQKLVYFAHARMLSLHGRPLISQNFEAWQYGPVVPELYRALSYRGSDRVVEAITMSTEAIHSARERDIVDWSFNKYSQLSGPELSKLTHAPDAPWARTKDQRGNIIPNDSIESYYADEWREETLEALRRVQSNDDLMTAVGDGMAQFECGEFNTCRTPAELESIVAVRAGRRA